MVANSQSFSPSAGKPALVMDSWQLLDVPLVIHDVKPATLEEFCLAHSASYVQCILECRGDNGFGNRLKEVANSLPYTTGAFIDAAKEAVTNGCVAVAPVSGFHHAHYSQSGGFCTFNGLVVAAQVLKRQGLVEKVGILDFDMHYGDGTVDIIRTLKLNDWLSQYTAGSQYHSANQAQEFLDRVPELVQRFVDCDIILYQAGADPHVADPLGGWLTTAQLAQRDHLVFQTAKEWNIPVVWNLAGGYQENFRLVLNIHDNTMKACAETYLPHP